MFNTGVLDISLTSVGLRLDKKLEKAIDEVKDKESIDKSTAIRMLVDVGYKEWKLRKALTELKENKVSLWQASKIAGMSLWDFTDLLKKEEGIEWAEFNPKEDQLALKHRR
ncbi:MAG: UPF0175 family protein [Nitrososphaerales archaeon]